MKKNLLQITGLLSILAACVYFYFNPNHFGTLVIDSLREATNIFTSLKPSIPTFADFK